jgi:hypothetical protein
MKIFGTFLALFLFCNCFSQEAIQLQNYDYKTLVESTLKIYAENGRIELTVINPNLIKVSYLQTIELTELKNVKPNQAFIRVTQNLENIYMQTDGLLIVISKLDFSIKFLNKKEQLYTTSQNISFENEGLNFKFFKDNDEVFYNSKNKKLKLKAYSIHKLKSIYSSKNYELLFDENAKGSLDFRNSTILNLKFSDGATFGYYFKAN